MIIVDQIERLINEHGSSSILSDHLTLIRDKAPILENDELNMKLREYEDFSSGPWPNLVVPPEGIK